jgi:REP element-mobilizing transposase RayT
MNSKNYRPKQYRKKIDGNPDLAITHTSYVLYYIVTWSTKNRNWFIVPEIRERVIQLLKEKAGKLGVHLLAVGVNPDHVHIIISLKPVHYIPEVVGELKGYTSHFINEDGPNYIEWTRGYDIRTLSHSHLQDAIRYVENQDERHKGEYNGINDRNGNPPQSTKPE